MQVEERVELKNLKLLYFLYAFLIIALIVMPQYFGIHIGIDLTCTRFANIFILLYMIFNKPILTHFIKTSLRCEVLIPLGCYLFVAFYTMVFRTDFKAFFLVFIEILTFFMMVYGIRYVVGVKKTIKWILGCAYFLSVEGLVEYAYGQSIYLKFLATMPTIVNNGYRSGHYRVMGPCGHSIGYGLFLLLFTAIACLDYEKNKFYIFKRPVLLCLLLINVLLTGSRSTLGLVILLLAIIFIFSDIVCKKKSILIATGLLIGLVSILVIFKNTSFARYILGQMMSVVDQVFDTNYAEAYGIDVTTLENSTEYRKSLPLIFTLDWLNPLVGRGNNFSGAEINGVYIRSIDHFYVSQYIKYAYPGLFSYVFYLVVAAVILVRDWIKTRSYLVLVVLVGLGVYFLNLWWVDALQTLKIAYLFMALYYAFIFNQRDSKKKKENGAGE